MSGKKASISARISVELRQRIDRMHERFRTSDAKVAEDALSALVNYVESRGKYEWPFKIVFDSEVAANVNWLAAESADHGAVASQAAVKTLIGTDYPLPQAEPPTAPESPPIAGGSHEKKRSGEQRRNKKPAG